MKLALPEDSDSQSIKEVVKGGNSELNSDSDGEYCSDDEYDDEESYDSDLDSETSIYQLAKKRQKFVGLNIMILMEYAEGETLRSLIDESGGYLNRRMIFHLFTQLMVALQQIHSKGLIHRDIKPENIFLNRRTNRLQVGDFGLAKTVKLVDSAGETGLKRSRQSLACNTFNNNS